MNKVILLTTLVVLSGCVMSLDTARDTISAKGADAMDQLLVDAEWFMCYGASIGAIKRKYSGDKADAYNRLCKMDSSNIIVTPEN